MLYMYVLSMNIKFKLFVSQPICESLYLLVYSSQGLFLSCSFLACFTSDNINETAEALVTVFKICIQKN